MERGGAKIRLFVDASLAVDGAVGLSAERAHYLKHVMRLKRGDEIAVFNGRDGEWRAAIEGFGRGWCSLDLRERSRAQTAVPDLWLLFAPIKRARVDFIAEKATELGAAELMPVITRYTAIRRVNTQRLRANAIEAAEQCGRLSVPEVHEPEALEAWLDRPRGRFRRGRAPDDPGAARGLCDLAGAAHLAGRDRGDGCAGSVAELPRRLA
jgi:16S rRNA (uracil1498-N3)-methyltransferase